MECLHFLQDIFAVNLLHSSSVSVHYGNNIKFYYPYIAKITICYWSSEKFTAIGCKKTDSSASIVLKISVSSYKCKVW